MNNLFFDSSKRDNILKALNERLAFAKSPLTELIVCGGSALNALGLIERATKDIDVLAMMDDAGRPIRCIEFPDYLLEAINKVTDDLNLPDGWINLGPSAQLDSGLPEGFFKRLHTFKYGDYLVLHYIDRTDQIYFKLYAAADQGPASRHFQDLLKLEPDENEIYMAALWAIEQDVSIEFREQLRECLLFMEFKDAAGRI